MGLFGNKKMGEDPSIKREASETPRSKETAQAELMEKFGLRKTSDFQLALQKGEIEKAKNWLTYIIDNKEKFPQYLSTWDNWLNDRQNEIKLYKELKENGSLEKMEHRSKEEAQAELKEKFGFADTKGFRNELQSNIQNAEAWLNYIIANKLRFPQYLSTWDNWLSDRQQELAQAK